jgi:hypothetical protein
LSGSGKPVFQAKTSSPAPRFSNFTILQTGFENTIFMANPVAELSTAFWFNQQGFRSLLYPLLHG